MNLQELLAKLDAPIVIRPTRRMTQGELESYLDKAADILRGNADHSEFRGYVFALLFYKLISDCYEEEVRTQVDALAKAGMPKDQAILLARDPQNHHFTVPEHAAWADVARTAKGQLGQSLNDAMLAIERANAHRQNNFDGILTGKIDFNKQDELPRDKLVNLINHFSSQTFDRAHVSDDLFGNAYEYLIRNFASKAGKSSGEFYTPAEVGFLMAEVLQPRAGMSICDWASGSGGLLLQCIRHVKKHGGDVKQRQPVAQARQLMLTHSFSFLPVYLGSWKLISETAVARYLRGAGDWKSLMSMPIERVAGKGLTLLDARVVRPGDNTVELLHCTGLDMDPARLWLVEEGAGRLCGVLSPFELM